MPESPHTEEHVVNRIGWLRAAVLGANDGIVSTASLIVGVAAANAATSEIVVAGVAGLVAGAMSMAAGEYVSVSSQSDTERAELVREAAELKAEPDYELRELAQIYEGRGLTAELAHQVAVQLTKHDALAAHARDELGISDLTAARPIQAAWTSALTFAVGAALPLATAILVPRGAVIAAVSIGSLVFLAALGAPALMRAVPKYCPQRQESASGVRSRCSSRRSLAQPLVSRCDRFDVTPSGGPD